MQHADQKYINALVNNDAVLIEAIYAKFSGKIKWMVLKNNGTETEAADIFQEVLLWICKRAKGQNFILTCPLEAFLYMACKNRWLSELNKRRQIKVTVNDFSLYNKGEDIDELTEEFKLQMERKDLLAEKLGELGQDCRKLLELNWSGKSMEEVAGLLNITYGYARKKKCECMAKLVELIKSSSRFQTLKR